MAFSKRA